MAYKSRVVVSGLRETLNGIKAMEAQAPKTLREAMKRVALLVVEDVRRKVPFMRGNAARSVKARGGVKGASIAVGGAQAPHYPWLDFGGTVGHGHRKGQAWSGATYRRWEGKPYGKGRYLYPAIDDNADEAQELFVDELNGLLRQYGMKAEE